MKRKFQYSNAAVCYIPSLTISWKETMRGQCNPACSSCRKKQNQKKKQPHSSVSSSWAPAVDTGCMKRKASNNHIKEEVISCAPSITLLSGGSRKKHCFLSSTFPGTGRGRGRSPVGPTQCLGMAARLGTAPIQHHGRWTVPTGKLTKLGGSHPKNGAKKKKSPWLPGGIHQLRFSEQRKQKLRNEAGTTGMFHLLWLTCSVLVAKQKLFFLKLKTTHCQMD